MKAKISRWRAFLHMSAICLAVLLVMKLLSGPSSRNLSRVMSDFADKEGLVTRNDILEIISLTEMEAQVRGKYVTKTHFFRKESSNSNRGLVCLATHSSLDRLHSLSDIRKAWGDGPISLALFAPEADFHVAVVYLKYLLQCSPELGKRLSVHATFPVTARPKESEELSDLIGGMSCDDPKRVLDLLLQAADSKTTQPTTFSYPQNLLRNVAAQGCSETKFVLSTDIDVIPRMHLDRDLQSFQGSLSGCEKCALVVPIFEVSVRAHHLPVDKAELVQYIKLKKARELGGQRASDLEERWLATPEGAKEGLLFKVERYEFGYQPIYVTKSEGVPKFDERFVGYRLTRSTQTFEMHVAGFEFFVLTNAFASHMGFNTVADDAAATDLRAQRHEEEDSKRLPDFVKELADKYEKGLRDINTKLSIVNTTKAAKMFFWNAASDN